jgi:hypothetical protein
LLPAKKHPKAASEKNKITLTFGLYDPSEWESGFYNIYDYLKSYVREFNRNSRRINVEIISYGPSDDPSSYLKATTAVNSGSMPDLMLVTGLSCERVADKGYFVDLYEFLEDGDRSSVVDKADLFSGPLKAMEYDGGLYWISPEFSLVSFCGLSSVLGNVEGLTIEGLFDIWNGFDRNKSVFLAYGENRARAFEIFMSTHIYKDYIDYKKKTCNFDDQSFIDLLELFATLPNKFPKTPMLQSHDIVVPEILVSEKEAMLCYKELAMLQSLDIVKSCSTDEEIILIGAPWGSDASALCRLKMPISISSSCKHKEEAWVFLASLLSNRQRYVFQGTVFPLNRKMLEAHIEEFYSEYWGLYENGEESVLPYLTCEYSPPFFQLRMLITIIKTHLSV